MEKGLVLPIRSFSIYPTTSATCEVNPDLAG